MKIIIDDIEPIAHDLMGHCQKRLGISKLPGLFFAEDPENAKNTLGKTAYYDPSNKDVVVFITNRHTKDVLRSIAHELIHHMQNLRGDFDDGLEITPGYAQKNPKLRKMEAEAYLLGNMLFRDWEDSKKLTKIQENKENFKMIKNTIRNMIKERLLGLLKEAGRPHSQRSGRTGADLDREAKMREKDFLKKKEKEKKVEEVCGKRDDEELEEGNWDPRDAPPKWSQRVDSIRGDDRPESDEGSPLDFAIHAPSKGGWDEEEGLPHPFETQEEYEEYLRVGKEMEDEYKIDTAMDSLDGFEEDLNEGDPDSPASRALTGGIRKAQKAQSDDEKAAAEKKEEDDKANSPASQALRRGFGPKNEAELEAIRTPEQENALYESRFGPRDTRLFKKLVSKWAK